MSRGRVRSVNVGAAVEVPHRDGTAPTGIFKHPVEGRVSISGVHVGDDVQADTENHGGAAQAVYAYDRADLDHWAAELGAEVPDGGVGENLTLVGIDTARPVIGSTWQVGTATLSVTAPRIPCWKLGHRLGVPDMAVRFRHARRWGTYLAIVEAGDVAAGDDCEVVSVPDHGVTIDDWATAWYDPRADLSLLRSIPDPRPELVAFLEGRRG